jgi:ankyrin repeat domain-containing protein 50
MADPLSIASGIAGLLSLGFQVTQSLVAFYSAYKDQDADLSKITRNLENLQGIFQSLDVALRDCQIRSDAQELFQELEKATKRCDDIIKELQVECQKFQKDSVTGFKGRIQVAGRRAAYPFRRSTLQKLEEDTGEIREILSFALDVLQLKGHNQIQDDISELKLLIERTNAHHLSLAIHAWLKAPGAFSDHNAACAKRHQLTGLWFINSHHFTNWLMERNSFLWLNGFAGCGKSVLCSTIIQHTFREMKQRNGVGIAFFYFSFTDESKQDDDGMLRALLLQLSGQLQDGQKDLEKLYALYQLRTPPVYVLLELLQQFLGQFCDSYIVLDALDESPRDYKRGGVLRAIQEIRNWSLPSVHILVTSRNELDILESLRPSSEQNLLMKNVEIDSDIAEFVSYQLRNDQKLQRWKSRHGEIQAILTTRAQGV